MPFLIETTFAFAGIEQGWSESFYWNQSNSDLQQAEATITPIAQKRAKLLAKDYMLTVVRNAVVKDEAGAKVKRMTDLFEPRIAGVQSWESSTPNLALLCLWQNATNTASKKQYMRGIPAQIGDLGKTPDLSFGAFLSNFNSWRSALIALSAGWLAATVSQTAVINSYTVDADTGIVTFTLAAPGLTWQAPIGFQNKVYVQLPGKNPLDGPIMVIPANATTCTTAEPIGVHPFQPGQLGVMQLKTSALVTIAAAPGQQTTGMIHPQRIVTHKTGRPSYASRGRAEAKAKW